MIQHSHSLLLCVKLFKDNYSDRNLEILDCQTIIRNAVLSPLNLI